MVVTNGPHLDNCDLDHTPVDGHRPADALSPSAPSASAQAFAWWRANPLGVQDLGDPVAMFHMSGGIPPYRSSPQRGM